LDSNLKQLFRFGYKINGFWIFESFFYGISKVEMLVKNSPCFKSKKISLKSFLAFGKIKSPSEFLLNASEA